MIFIGVYLCSEKKNECKHWKTNE